MSTITKYAWQARRPAGTENADRDMGQRMRMGSVPRGICKGVVMNKTGLEYRWSDIKRRITDAYARANDQLDRDIWTMEETLQGTEWWVKITDQAGLVTWIGPMEITNAVMSADSIARYGQRAELEPA